MFTVPCLSSLSEPSDPQAAAAFNDVVHIDYFETNIEEDTCALGAAFAHVCALNNYDNVEGGSSLTVGIVGWNGPLKGARHVGKTAFSHGLAHSFDDLIISAQPVCNEFKGDSSLLGHMVVVDAWRGLRESHNSLLSREGENKGAHIIEHANDAVRYSDMKVFHVAVDIDAVNMNLRKIKITCDKSLVQTPGYQKFLKQAEHLRCAAFR